jgi:hypothetical protein
VAKSIYYWQLTLVAVALSTTLTACRTIQQPSSELYVTETQNMDTIPRYSVFELSFKHNGIYVNNFFDVDLQTIFTSPDGAQHAVKGFFYGGDLWKIRFRPDQTGNWSYSYTFSNNDGFQKRGAGTFWTTSSSEDGPVRSNLQNPYRWVFASRKPYFPVGLEECVYLRGDRLAGTAIDGEDRNHPGRGISWDDYFSLYGQAGFNLFRFSQKNCSYSLLDDLDHYRAAQSILTDRLLSSAREHGFRVMFGFFGIHGNWPSDNRAVRVFERTMNRALGRHVEAISDPEDHELMRKEERFIEYCIARWGVYADYWELLNERQASDKWTTTMAEYTRSADPDRKPISTSWEKPELPAIDINAPHWYESEDELSSDVRVQEQAEKWKRARKPVIVGEQGNSGMNWDPGSAVRMRIRAWTALFQEISLIFWNTSWSKAGMFGGQYTPGEGANIYLGPEERKYVQVLQGFASKLDANVRMAPVAITSATLVHSYGLLSKDVGAVYLQHAASHTTPAQGVRLSCDFSSMSHAQLTGEWIDPATGSVLSRVKIFPQQTILSVPSFNVDIALLVAPQPSGKGHTSSNLQ